MSNNLAVNLRYKLRDILSNNIRGSITTDQTVSIMQDAIKLMLTDEEYGDDALKVYRKERKIKLAKPKEMIITDKTRITYLEPGPDRNTDWTAIAYD